MPTQSPPFPPSACRPAESPPGPEAPDRELLRRFAAHRDQAAFEALVRRHGPMVLRVGRRVLDNAADAEDAFQATFLLLARKAGTADWQDSVANWLYGVAHRLARKAKAAAARRAVWGGRAPLRPTPDPLAEITGRELLNALDEELVRLPDKYREPVLLCYIEGLTRDEAARRLGCPLSTVKHRVARGKEMLGQALARRGVGLSLALLATLAVAGPGHGAFPEALLQSTLRGVRAGLGSPGAGTLTGLTKTHAVVLVLIGLVAAGAAVTARHKPLADSPTSNAAAGPPTEQPPQATDALGDALPAGALMRLGTRRHRVQASWHGLPDGKSYLVHQRDREIRRLDSDTGRVIETWSVPRDRHAAGISPDGRYLLLSRPFIHHTGLRLQGQKEVRQWELTLYDLTRRKDVWTNQEQLEEQHWKRVDSVCFSPDGKWIATAGHFGGELRLWDAATGAELWHKQHEGQSLEPLGFVAGDALVLRGREDNTIFLVERKTGKQVRSFPTMSQREAHTGTLSPDGRAVLFGNYSPAVRVWDVATGKEREPLGGHKAWAREIAFSPDGKTVVTGGNDPFVLVREWPSGKVVGTIEVGKGTVEQMAVSGDGRRLEVLFWGEQALRFFDLATGKALPAFLECHQSSVYGVAVAPDGALVSCGRDASVRTWDLKSGKAVGRLKVEQDLNAGGFALSGDGRLLAVANSDYRSLSVYERATGRLVRSLSADGRVGRDIVLSSDGRWGAAADGSSGVIQVWDVPSGKSVLRLKDPRPAYGVSCAFSPDGRLFASAEHGAVKFWDTDTWEEQWCLEAYAPLGLAFSPDGRTLATASVEGIRLYELATRRERAHVRPDGYPTGGLRFSATGRWLAWVNDHGTIHVWDAHRGELLPPFTGHDDRVTGLAFTTDGRALASSSEDSTILVWDVAGRAAKAPPVQGGDLDRAWEALAGEDARAGYEAIRVLAASPEKGVARIGRHLKPVAAADTDRVKACLRDLDSDDFRVRERASRDLEQLGEGAAPALERFLAGQPSPEARRRVADVLAAIAAERLRQIRALEALERIGDDPALRLLEAVARGAPDAWLTREAKAAVERLGGGVGGAVPQRGAATRPAP